MKRDSLAEMLTGKPGAIRCTGRYYIMPTGKIIEGFPTFLFAGVNACVVGSVVLPENEGYSEMWEADIIIIPKRKFSGKIDKKHYAFNGWRIGDVLTGDYGNPELWGREYFEVEVKK